MQIHLNSKHNYVFCVGWKRKMNERKNKVDEAIMVWFRIEPLTLLFYSHGPYFK